MRPLLLGILGGAVVGGVIFAIVKSQVDKSLAEGARQLEAGLSTGGAELTRRIEEGRAQLRTEIQRQLDTRLPGMVRTELTNTLNRYGITPDTGRRLDAVLAAAERAGVLR